MAVCVCLASNRFGLQRKKNDRQIYGAQSVFAFQLTMFGDGSVCVGLCAHTI